ncbi:MAG: hypothetical protein GWN87_27090, partial [Desulfuromonadales bacterium]|nr:hypothetical protein [Desulfuromonadales bacterium]
MILAIKDFDLSGFGISFEDLVKGLKAAGATFFAGDEIPEVETAEALFLPPPTNVTTTTNVG